jgi:hypothetical protein
LGAGLAGSIRLPFDSRSGHHEPQPQALQRIPHRQRDRDPYETRKSSSKTQRIR